MTAQYHLAIDIGASGGRHILGRLEDGVIRLEEVYRFPNGMTQRDGSLCWDVDALFGEVVAGLAECKKAGKIPVSVGIDTWGVDFVLLDKYGNMTGPAVAYRDSRTEGMDDETHKLVPEFELYERTGIQRQIFNTILQLMAVKTKSPGLLKDAEHLLMIPDYLHYRLCGKMSSEYTIASTTGLLGAASRDWDDEIIARCGFPRGLFGGISPPGTVLGGLSGDVRRAAGFGSSVCDVILPPAHDTASAFLAVPAGPGRSVYISSGTWSLMGVELPAPMTSEQCRAANFTNEGGYGNRYRFLKNIMGLWLYQSIGREIGGGMGYDEITALARGSDYEGIINVNDERLFAPDDMAAAIAALCRENGQPEPRGLGDLARCTLRSLASSYAQTIRQLEHITGDAAECINIIGGGSRNMLLNEFTAAACGLPVYAGPTEGTALGNNLSQMIAYGELSGVDDAREAVRRSFDVREVNQYS